MNLEELRAHYDETDTSAELEAAIEAGTARWETATEKDPLAPRIEFHEETRPTEQDQ